jgi:hypothetical protein
MAEEGFYSCYHWTDFMARTEIWNKSSLDVQFTQA